MQSVKDLSPTEFRRAYPDTCFTCHCRLKAYRYEEGEIITCSASCANKITRRGLQQERLRPCRGRLTTKKRFLRSWRHPGSGFKNAYDDARSWRGLGMLVPSGGCIHQARVSFH